MGKVAITMVAGPLHKWGYQHVCQECISSQCEFADHVYMVQSTSDTTGAQELLDRYSNLTLISNPGTWHHRPGETDERQGIAGKIIHITVRNLAIGKLAAFRDGYEIVLSTDNNWYIPRPNIEGLREYCENFRRCGKVTGRLWGVSQFCDMLFGPIRGELISNLVGMSEAQVRAQVLDTKLRRPGQKMIPRKHVWGMYFVDCNYEMYPEEFGANMLRFADYHLKTWDWPTYLRGRVIRMRKAGGKLNLPLDYWGQQIAAKSEPEFVSYQILQAMGLKK